MRSAVLPPGSDTLPVQIVPSDDTLKYGAWNDAFFGSFFTHPNVHGKLVTYKGGAFKFWRDMLDGRHGEFPEHVLVPAKRTLADALDRHQEAAR